MLALRLAVICALTSLLLLDVRPAGVFTFFFGFFSACFLVTLATLTVVVVVVVVAEEEEEERRTGDAALWAMDLVILADITLDD